ncbi:glycosyltransferase family 9 protein [Shewanella sp.]|uniref:glycosyltransferase family 9 protein n=1 Tax=Shewanella sp. TaxID=50422 RepID=UPI0035654B29
MSRSPRVLFVPVSSAEGIGEYMRSVILADAISSRWKDAEIHFVLSRQAPYSSQCPYPVTLVDKSPTKEVKAVNTLMAQFKPDLVIFDASGRKSQLQCAHQLGAKVIFISQHKRKRSRGLKIGRARVTDSHWVVQPEFVIGPISVIDRFKLQLIGKPEPIFTGPVFTNPDAQRQFGLLQNYGLSAGEYAIFNAGSGGHKVADLLAADIFSEVARNCYRTHGIKSLMVFGPNYPKDIPQYEGVISVAAMSNAEFINLLAAAKVAVISGGDTLLQAIALKVPTLTAPVSKDQPARIAACEKEQLVMACPTNPEAMSQALGRMLQPENLSQLKQRLLSAPALNGLQVGMEEIIRLLEKYPEVQS